MKRNIQNWNPPRKKRPRKNYMYRNNHVINNRTNMNNKINYLPYTNIKDGDNLLFFANTDNYDIGMISNWLKWFNEAFPKVNCIIVPDDMFYAVPKLTGKEYTVINNILKKIKDKVV